jgi:transcription elongation factor GreA
MQLPKRKPGKFSQIPFDPYVTQEKYDEMVSNVERLKKKKIPAAAEVRRTAANGDFSENAAYQSAKGKLRGILSRIDILTEQLARAVVIKKSGGDTVQIGSTVTVEMGGQQRAFTILGSSQTDPDKGIISYQSPIGAALMGRKVGESFVVKRANAEVACRILTIE